MKKWISPLAWLFAVFAALIWPLDEIEAQTQSWLHVKLALKDGYFVADRNKTTFDPSVSFGKNYKGTMDEARVDLINHLDNALRNSGKAISLSLSIEERAQFNPNDQSTLSKFQGVINFTGDWEKAQSQFKNWGITHDVTPEAAHALLADPILTVLFQEDGGLSNALVDSPFLWDSLDATDYEISEKLYQGLVSFPVADPVSESDLEGREFHFRTNPGCFEGAGVTTRLLGKSLRPLKGKLWLRPLIQRQVGDVLADIGFPSRLIAIDQARQLQWHPGVYDRGQMPPELFVTIGRAANERTIHLDGPARISEVKVVVGHKDFETLMKVLYHLLPDADFRAIRSVISSSPADYLKFTREKVLGGEEREVVTLDYRKPASRRLSQPAPYVNQRQVLRQLGQIAGLGFIPFWAAIEGTSVEGYPASDTRWIQLLLAATSNLEKRNSEVDETKKPARMQLSGKEFRNHLRIGGGVQSKQPPTALLEYTRDGVFASDHMSLKVGWRGEAIFGGNYQRDFIGFESLGRRLSLKLDGDSDFRPDRLVNSQRVDERRSGGGVTAQLDLFRDRANHWLRLEVALSHQEVKLKDTAPHLSTDGISRGTLGLSYGWLRESVVGSPGLELTPSLTIGRPTHNGSGFIQSSIKAAYHRNLLSFFEIDSRACLDMASSDTPETEWPRFGGEDSVRGFRLEAASGRVSWSFQNELWIPIRFTDYFGETIDNLLRRNLKLAAFVDVGGLSRSQQTISSFEAGAGIGLRFTMSDQATLRLDWAHPMTRFSKDQGGHSFYFSVVLRPVHF